MKFYILRIYNLHLKTYKCQNFKKNVNQDISKNYDILRSFLFIYLIYNFIGYHFIIILYYYYYYFNIILYY